MSGRKSKSKFCVIIAANPERDSHRFRRIFTKAIPE
jgi:hypothetical protein